MASVHPEDHLEISAHALFLGLWDPDHRRWHDLLTSTIVMKDRDRGKGDLP